MQHAAAERDINLDYSTQYNTAIPSQTSYSGDVDIHDNDVSNYEAPYSQRNFFQHARQEQQTYVRDVLHGRQVFQESGTFPQEYYTPEEMYHIYDIHDGDEGISDGEDSIWAEYGHSGPINPFSDPRIYDQLGWGQTPLSGPSGVSPIAARGVGETRGHPILHPDMGSDPAGVRGRRDFITAIEFGMRIQRQQQLRTTVRAKDSSAFRDQDSAVERENKQRAANALHDHSTLLLHALSMNETPTKARMRMYRHLTGLPQPQHDYAPSKRKYKEKETENANTMGSSTAASSRSAGSSHSTLPQETSVPRPRRHTIPVDEEFAHTYFQGPLSP
ncbi:hypothetical protein EDD11_005010 [Mortierella claussenii]|nr:hypothetical protein EDD11_005010 [Mortierella claussenii]